MKTRSDRMNRIGLGLSIGVLAALSFLLGYVIGGAA